MDKLTEQCFDPAAKFFKETSDHLLYPDPTSSVTPGYTRHFEFMGRYVTIRLHVYIMPGFFSSLSASFCMFN